MHLIPKKCVRCTARIQRPGAWFGGKTRAQRATIRELLCSFILWLAQQRSMDELTDCCRSTTNGMTFFPQTGINLLGYHVGLARETADPRYRLIALWSVSQFVWSLIDLGQEELDSAAKTHFSPRTTTSQKISLASESDKEESFWWWIQRKKLQ